MVSVAVVSPRVAGGVKYSTETLVKGLKREGFSVNKIVMHSHGLFVSDIVNMRHLRHLHTYDTIVFMGSVPPLFHAFMNKDVKLLLFVHGFVYHESLAALKQGGFKAKVGTLYSLSRFELARKIDNIDIYICRSVTTCEANRIKRYILLPQFVFPEEFQHYGKRSTSTDKRSVRILSYTSYANSPRLLREDILLLLMKQVSRKTNKPIEFIIINPTGQRLEWMSGNLVVRRISFLPRDKFLALLASADLYVERCIDEELGWGSIDAGLVGTPIAKLTHPFFVDRQDYTDEVLWAQSPIEFIEILVNYINNVENEKYVYSRRYQEFLLTKRNWDNVKHVLLNAIRASVR